MYNIQAGYPHTTPSTKSDRQTHQIDLSPFTPIPRHLRSQNLFNCPKHQTETPLSPHPPSVAPTIPVSPADWGPLSSPKQPAAVQTGSPEAGAGLGVS